MRRAAGTRQAQPPSDPEAAPWLFTLLCARQGAYLGERGAMQFLQGSHTEDLI